MEVRYSVHSPTLATVITLQKFHYFKLYLENVGKFFTQQQPWNRDYLQAQRIYGDNPSSMALCKAIQTEHSILYSNRPGRLGTKKGVIRNTPDAFFQLLQENSDTGILRNREALELYTYVLMPESLRFSRTSAKANIDISSKHALHAGGSPTVTYAGEFWIQNDDGKQVLYVDNNSGTFGPPKDGLVNLKALLQDTFPGINVVILDYQDPVWKAIRKKPVC